MPLAGSESPDDNFFNDLSQQAESNDARQPPNSHEGQKDTTTNIPKRIACVLCRRRKLRCDGARPACGTCKRLAHNCAYDEVRKKSGPKRGYVKLLEARLQQVETLLKSQGPTDHSKNIPHQDSTSAYVASTTQNVLPGGDYLGSAEKAPATFPESISPGLEAFLATSNAHSGEGDFSWEMIGLGLDEPLPPQDDIDDLYQHYFTKVHPILPIVHRPRFMAAMNLAPHMRPSVCLRYAMWTLAASVTDKYDGLQEHFYQRARKYAQIDEMKGHGESTITLGHCQTWILLSTYEFKQMFFPRAWLSSGRATRLAQMMQLHRLDGAGLDVKQCLPPPRDWTEREERRRTLWMAFCVDRYASIGTGWPMSIDERDILTNLPSSEESFEKSKPMSTVSLEQAMEPNGASDLQSFGGVVLTAALFGRDLLHLHRPSADDQENDLNGGFWTRHSSIETILLNTSLGLPDLLRLPSGLPDPNVVFMNMSIHTAAICLHQAAIFKAGKHQLPPSVANESKIRCVTAAAEIASIMRMISHMDLAVMNPFVSFCVYVAARVFVQSLKTRPKDQQMYSSLQFLVRAMHALRRKNPLTGSFLVQLDLDLESAGLLGLQQKPYTPINTNISSHATLTIANDILCGTVFEVRENQSVAAPLVGFANGDVVTENPATAYNTISNGPPYHIANSTQTVPTFVPSQAGNNMEIPFRDKSTDSSRYASGGISLPPQGYNLDESSDMDTSLDGAVDQSSPATTNSQSRGGSTSQTPHSPGNQQQVPLQYRAPPEYISNRMPLPQAMTAKTTASFSTSTEDIYSGNMYSHPGAPTNGDSVGNGFIMASDWDMSTTGTGTELPPMSEGSWNQMLESIDLGWNTVGPSHAPNSHTSNSR